MQGLIIFLSSALFVVSIHLISSLFSASLLWMIYHGAEFVLMEDFPEISMLRFVVAGFILNIVINILRSIFSSSD